MPKNDESSSCCDLYAKMPDNDKKFMQLWGFILWLIAIVLCVLLYEMSGKRSVPSRPVDKTGLETGATILLIIIIFTAVVTIAKWKRTINAARQKNSTRINTEHTEL